MLWLNPHARKSRPHRVFAPYKGLLFFDESDADLFFGRAALTAHLANRIAALGQHQALLFLAIVGASGSGKSSLVRAGLAVTLKRAGWQTFVFTPTAQPLKMLETQLGLSRAQVDAGPVLLLVDQFEETFTLCHDEATRQTFIDALVNLATLPLASPPPSADGAENKIVVVIALRADFYAHCAQYPQLRQAVAAQQKYIGQMTSGRAALRHRGTGQGRGLGI